jgi:hypothetical protein
MKQKHLKIETRLMDERFPSIFKVIRSDAVLTRMLSTLDLICE